MHVSPQISISSLEAAELISVAEAAEKTYSQQQTSSQAYKTQDEEEQEQEAEAEEEDQLDTINSKTTENGPSTPKVKKNHKKDIIQPNEESNNLKRKASLFEDGVQPDFKRSHLTDLSTSSKEEDIKPSSVDLTVDSKPTTSYNQTKMHDQSNQTIKNLDQKPIDLDEIETNKKTDQVETNKNSSSNSAEQILNDFTRRICNSIYRLNKSLLDLASNNHHHQQDEILKLFNSNSIQDHVNLLVRESFYNPHLPNGSNNNINTNHRQGTSRNSKFVDFNDSSSGYFGGSRPLHRGSEFVYEDDLSGSSQQEEFSPDEYSYCSFY